MNNNSTRNEHSARFWAILVLGKSLVQVIWTRILLGMNLEQNVELQMYTQKPSTTYLNKNCTGNELRI